MKQNESTVGETLDTYFDTPARTEQGVIIQAHQAIESAGTINELLEGFSDPAVLLDHNRQIVLLNSLAVDLFKGIGTIDAIARRIGEAIQCIHSDEMPAGCGTSRACATCGVAAAIHKTQNEMQRDQQDARVTFRLEGKERSLDLRATTTSVDWDGKTLFLVSLKDISDEKRRQALERIFFHDILNTAGAVSNIATLLPDTDDPAELSELYSMLNCSGEQLIQEIQSQRDLVRAERGDLNVSPSEVSASQILAKVKSLYENSQFAENKELRGNVVGDDFNMMTDQTMLVRCLGNLVKNALEASGDGQKIDISATCDQHLAKFEVKNENVMPENVKLQVFQRSFSTKGEKGRGLGTYSVKLLVEQYLCGKVTFESTKGAGTIFTIVVPRFFSGKSS